jgi:hypothetical protein
MQNEVDNEDEADRIVILGPRRGAAPAANPTMAATTSCTPGPSGTDAPSPGKKKKKIKEKRKAEKSGGDTEDAGKKRRKRVKETEILGDVGGEGGSGGREGGSGEGGRGEPKWGKIAQKVLVSCGRGMKLRKLCKGVVTASGVEPTTAVLEAIESRVRTSKKFAVGADGIVTLS